MIVHQMRGFGDMADTQMLQLQNQVRDATRGFNGKAFTAKQALPILQRALAMARANMRTAFVAVGAGGLPQQLYTDVNRQQTQLEYLVKHLTGKGSNPYKYTSADKTWKDVRTAVIDPIVWQSGYVAVQKVYDEADQKLASDIVAGIKNLPASVVGAAAGYVVEQAKKIVEGAVAPLIPGGLSKGVPSWVFPTVVGGIALGVGLWAYGNLRRVTG